MSTAGRKSYTALLVVAILLTVTLSENSPPSCSQATTVSYDRVYLVLNQTVEIFSLRQAHMKKELTVKCITAKNLKSLDWGFPSAAGDGARVELKAAYDVDGGLKAEVVTYQNSKFVRIHFRNPLNPGDIYSFAWEFDIEWDYDNCSWKSEEGTSRLFYNLILKVLLPRGFGLVIRNPRTAVTGMQDGQPYAELQLENVASGRLWVFYFLPQTGPVETPMIGTKWDQNGMYALKSPVIRGEHVRLGCWSTAIGQIINFHRLESYGKVRYSCSNGIVIENDLDARFYNWSRMAVALTKTSPSEEVEEVSTFLYDVATVVQKDFDTGTYVLSSANMTLALQRHFKCKSEVVSTTDIGSSVKDYIKQELGSNRPCMLYIEDDAPPGSRTGHAVVIDGWKVEADSFLVHLNMGWGGRADGWYDFDKPIDMFTNANYRLVLSIRPRDLSNSSGACGSGEARTLAGNLRPIILINEHAVVSPNSLLDSMVFANCWICVSARGARTLARTKRTATHQSHQ